MKVTRIIAAVAMSTVLAGTAQAQSGPTTNTANCTGGIPNAPACAVLNTVQATVPWVARMEIVASTSLPSPTASDFGNGAGVSTTTATTLSIRANAGVTVTATAGQTFWNGPVATKPASDLRIFLPSAPTTNVPLSNTTGLQVFRSTAATATGSVNIGYNVLYSWETDVPGSYNMPVNYTLTSP